ncbi:MAG TPA: zinc ribbon domain-containing protein [Gemmatimonadaceae bacterium]|nr:zinc ribbon domain-containing protein [Gemmatimonadaceae bacterium]
MPTYEYRCPQGHDFEKFYSRMSESEGVLACPLCGQEAERRISGGAGLVFKGSGFYLTDYGKNAHRKAAPDAAAKKDAGGGTDGAGGKSEKPTSEPAAAKNKSPGGGSSGGGSSGSAGGGNTGGGSTGGEK